MNEKMFRTLFKNKLNKKEYIEDIYGDYLNNNKRKAIEESKNYNKNSKIANKFKYIVNKIRETGKYEYKKQEIPEYLKYHTDSDSSGLSNEKKLCRNKEIDISLTKNKTERKYIINNLKGREKILFIKMKK